MSTSVLIVSYNTRELTLRCLTAVRAGSADNIVVVDNASHDGSADAVADHFPEVTLVRLPANLGWGRAVNRAVSVATGDHLLLLNPDAEPVGDVAGMLSRFALAHPGHGIYTGRTLRPDGTDDGLSCLGFPTLWSCLCFGLGLNALFRGSRVFNPEALPRVPRGSVRQVPAVSGCLMLVERHVFDALGGFHPRYFLYSEDVDLCWRARGLGYRPLLTPEASVRHVGGASQEPAGKRIRMLRGRCTFLVLRWRVPARVAGQALLLAGVLLRAVLSPGWRPVWRARRVWVHGWPADPTAVCAGGTRPPASPPGGDPSRGRQRRQRTAAAVRDKAAPRG